MNNDLNKLIDKSREHIIIDAELLPLKKKAKAGDIDALIKLSEAFRTGKKAKKNYTLSKEYAEKLFDSLDDKYELAKYYTLWNLAVLEADYGNYENLKERFYQIIDFMQKNIPMEDWKFEIFDWIKETVDGKNNQ